MFFVQESIVNKIMNNKKLYSPKLVLSLTALVFCSINVWSKPLQIKPIALSSYSQNLPEVVTDTLKSYDGKILIANFNNITGIFKFTLEGKTIIMKQIRSGSGVRAKNARYEYTNWQGQTIIKKNNEVIFQTKP